MAKKKVNNVVIKDEELVPTTLGVYSNKTKSPIIVFFILAIFLLIAFYMPDIQKSIDKLMGKETNTQNNNNKPINPGNNDKPDKPDVPDTPVDDEKHIISSDTKIDNDDFTADGFIYENGVLSFSITPKKSVNLSPYFIELYSDDNMLLGRAKISDSSLSQDSTQSFSVNVPSGSSKMSFVKKTIDDYPEVALSYNDKNEASIVCKNNLNEEYIYTFVSNQLVKIVYSYKLSSTAPGYDGEYSKYVTLDEKYKNIDKVSSSLINSDNGFDYTLNLNLSEVSIDDVKQIDLEGIFKVKSQAKEVKFINEAKGYKCEI